MALEFKLIGKSMNINRIIRVSQFALVGCVALPISSLACDDHHGACELEAWRHTYTAGILSIEGSATCNKGFITIRLYDGDSFIGVANGFVDGHTAQAAALDISRQPESLTLKYSISPD